MTEDELRAATIRDLDFAHAVLAIPPGRYRMRMLIRAGVRLTRRIEVLEPSGRHKRCWRIRNVLALALVAETTPLYKSSARPLDGHAMASKSAKPTEPRPAASQGAASGLPNQATFASCEAGREVFAGPTAHAEKLLDAFHLRQFKPGLTRAAMVGAASSPNHHLPPPG